jgi:hypothetical protein
MTRTNRGGMSRVRIDTLRVATTLALVLGFIAAPPLLEEAHALERVERGRYTSALVLRWSTSLETQGPLGTLWVGFGLFAFYIALIWLNTLLAVFLTPLFIIPGTWLLEWLQSRRRGEQQAKR